MSSEQIVAERDGSVVWVTLNNPARRNALSLAMWERLGEVLEGWKARWPIVGDVRGLGPMMVVEFVRSRETKAPAAPETTLQTVRSSVSNGVTQTTGPKISSWKIRICGSTSANTVAAR